VALQVTAPPFTPAPLLVTTALTVTVLPATAPFTTGFVSASLTGGPVWPVGLVGPVDAIVI
jgi:hypothetical protein